MSHIKEGYIEDYISGQEIKATPEEIESVQVFAKQLVEDYDYDKEQIQTRPQWRVKSRPSDNAEKGYPVDIIVFDSKNKTEENSLIIVECKKKTRKDGRSQLEDYLKFSKAFLGVWFNGTERLFLKKIEKEGKVLFHEIPNIPKKGQRIEDVGKYARKDLKVPHNLKADFKTIRNYLAQNTVGATRDEKIAQQLINVIFCKIYDERFTKQEDFVKFRAGISEDPKDVQKRISEIFENVKKKYQDVIDQNDEIELDENSLYYTVGALQNYCITESKRDVIADAFETFIGKALKGSQGQFFTPRNVVQMMVEILEPNEEEIVFDPACGSGGFLVESLRFVWKKIEDKGKEYGWSDKEIEKQKQKVAATNFIGIDKDSFLSKVTKAYMAIIGDGNSGIFCEDSLELPKNWEAKTQQRIKIKSSQVILTNPPFGDKIPVTGKEKLEQYELGHKWKKGKTGWEKTSKVANTSKKGGVSPQIIFIERVIQCLEIGGRCAIVLPDGILGNDKFGYIREFIQKSGRILAIIDVPVITFMPNTSTKTSILVFQKLEKIPEDYSIFMAIADTCGHDRRGNEIEDDDIQNISETYHEWKEKNGITH